MPGYDVVTMTSEHIDDVMKLLVDCGKLTINHKELFYGLLDLNPGLSWGAVERGTGRVISFILLTRQPDETFLIGRYFTRPEYRGLGIGTSVFDACVTAVRDKGTVRLSTANMIHKYPTKGFMYRGFEVVGTTGYSDIMENGSITSISNDHMCIRPYMTTDFDKLAEYDLKISAMRRAAVLKLHLKTCVAAVVAFSGGDVIGYATTQWYFGFVCIQPLYADNHTIATSLVKSVFHSLEPGTPVFVCCPSGIRQQFWKQLGISTSSKCAHLWMTNRPVEESNLDGVYSHYSTWYMTV